MPKVTLAGRVHVRPAGVETETDRLTVPVNPFRAVTVIVEVPDAPANIWLGLTTLAEMLKSFDGEKVTETVRVSVPLVPLTTTVKATAQVPPAVRVAVFGVGSVTLAGEMLFVQPAGGAALVIVKAIPPVNPFRAFAVIVEVELLGGEKLTVDGLALRLKSTTWNRIVPVLWDSVPSVPVTVTV